MPSNSDPYRIRGLNEAKRGLDLAIHATPTGPSRDLLTVANMMLSAVMDDRHGAVAVYLRAFEGGPAS